MFKNRKTKLNPPIQGPGVDNELLEEQREFYYALGRAVSEWASVEEKLYLLYSKIINSKNLFGMSASYHAAINISTKIEIIDSSLRATYFDKSTIDDWTRLLSRIKTKNTKRNHIVHYSTMFNISKKAGDKIYLMPSIHNFNSAISGKTLSEKHNYNTKKLEEIVSVFSSLAHDIHDFVLELPYPEHIKEPT